jgi:hypothetical protein
MRQTSNFLQAAKAVGVVVGVPLAVVGCGVVVVSFAVSMGLLILGFLFGGVPQFFVQPSALLPLFLALLAGCLVGACSRRIIWPVLTWILLPLVVAVGFSLPIGLLRSSGESGGWAFLYFLNLASASFATVGFGLLAGGLVRKFKKHAHGT